MVCVWMDRDYSALVLDCRSRELQAVCALSSGTDCCQSLCEVEMCETDQNPADVGNRSILSEERLEIFLKKPRWLNNQECRQW